MSTSIDFLQGEVKQAITRSCAYLFSVQKPHGSWYDHISSSALATSIVLCALYHADCQRFKTVLHRGCVWLRETQHEDGGWGDAVVDASTLGATALAIAALKLIDPENSASTIEHALAHIDLRGGFAAVANPKECSMNIPSVALLALAGLYPWERVSRIPLAFILLPKSLWQHFSVMLPNIFSWGLVHDRKLPTSLLHSWLNRLAKPKVLKWIESTRGVNGSWEDCPLITATVTLGLVLSGEETCRKGVGLSPPGSSRQKPWAGTSPRLYDNQMPTLESTEQVAPSLSYLLATQRADGSWPVQQNLELSVTTYILDGLEEAGLLDHPSLENTRKWLLTSYHDEPFAPTNYPGGWWSWGIPSGWPDVDDSAGAIIALRRLGVSASHPSIQKGCDSLCKLQNRDGSWNTFVKEAHTPMDRPSPALTIRAILALHHCREAPEQARYLSAIDRALDYLQQVQLDEGIWFSVVYTTAQVLDAYATLNRASEPVAFKCRTWLLEHQHRDGSWAEDMVHTGTVEETAWALTALAAPGVDAPDEALDRAATWLLQQQRSEGSWPPSVVCYYGKSARYSSDHVANGFALQALGRYHRLRT